MINQFQKCGYNRSLIEQKIDKANSQETEQLKKKKDTAATIPLLLKYNRILIPWNKRNYVMKHWHLLHINPNLAGIFHNPPNLAFCQKKKLRDIIGTKLIENDKVKMEFTKKMQS